MEYKLSEKTSSFLSRAVQGLYINGTWTKASTENLIDVIDPATEAKVSRITIATAKEVDQAVLSADAAFKSSTWRRMAPSRREKLLLDLADKLEAEAETIAEILTLENGKLLSHAKSEIRGAANTFRYYAGWATKLEGQTIDLSLKQPAGKQNFAFVRREPVGVVAAIVPWNFPISIAAWKLGPILAAGCTVVLKPSEVTPLATLYMANLFSEVGFPPGVVNVITGDATTGSVLTSHALVQKITFTGSTTVGKIIGRSAMDDLKPVSLELGGKSPGIIFEDANLTDAAKGIALGIFRNGGQVCVAGSRVYIHQNVFDKVVADIAAEGAKMKLGSGFDQETDLGPLVSKAHCDHVCSYIEQGIAEGAELVCGGQRRNGEGYYVEPTVFAATDNKKKIVAEEIFGPVLVAVPFKDIDDALQKANDSDYGLSSTVWTQNIHKALTCVDALNAGWVFVNSPARSDANFPLGGNKQSGMGRELGKVGVYNYTKLKSVNIVF